MAKYLYYALFEPEENGGYSVSFPDLPGCLTCGDDMSEALYMAKDALDGWMIGVENDNEPVVKSSEPGEIERPKDGLLIPIESDTNLARIKFGQKSVKKTLTIPSWLNEIGERHQVNFSRLLQDALVSYLNVDRPKHN